MTVSLERSALAKAHVAAIEIDQVSFRYGTKLALDQLSLVVPQGSLFGLLGPNGGGKTTLFRLLTTLAPLQSGRIAVGGLDLATAPDRVRRAIGVTFQAPSLDRRLTVLENLSCHGRLYGLTGAALHGRIDQLLGQLGLDDRRQDRVDSLSGGLARRVEIAKGLLHAPRLLLLDEPSTGLDPGARIDLWRYLRSLQSDGGVTVLLTTHLMEEAEKCDALALLDQGRVVAQGSPAELRAELGGDCLTLRSANPAELAATLTRDFGLSSRVLGPDVRIENQADPHLLGRLLERLGGQIESAVWARPTLEDVFVARTGHRFWSEA